MQVFSAAAIAVAILAAAPAEAASRSLVAAIIHVESGGNPRTVGRAGEIGLMQIKMQTARSVGYNGSRRGLFDPATNIRYGTAYLNIALRRTHGNACQAATLFNAGVYARPRCSGYGRMVLEAMR
jgi:soluble lytic murein transglycosylase-like protein